MSFVFHVRGPRPGVGNNAIRGLWGLAIPERAASPPWRFGHCGVSSTWKDKEPFSGTGWLIREEAMRAAAAKMANADVPSFSCRLTRAKTLFIFSRLSSGRVSIRLITSILIKVNILCGKSRGISIIIEWLFSGLIMKRGIIPPVNTAAVALPISFTSQSPHTVKKNWNTSFCSTPNTEIVFYDRSRPHRPPHRPRPGGTRLSTLRFGRETVCLGSAPTTFRFYCLAYTPCTSALMSSFGRELCTGYTTSVKKKMFFLLFYIRHILAVYDARDSSIARILWLRGGRGSHHMTNECSDGIERVPDPYQLKPRLLFYYYYAISKAPHILEGNASPCWKRRYWCTARWSDARKETTRCERWKGFVSEWKFRTVRTPLYLWNSSHVSSWHGIPINYPGRLMFEYRLWVFFCRLFQSSAELISN